MKKKKFFYKLKGLFYARKPVTLKVLPSLFLLIIGESILVLSFLNVPLHASSLAQNPWEDTEDFSVSPNISYSYYKCNCCNLNVYNYFFYYDIEAQQEDICESYTRQTFKTPDSYYIYHYYYNFNNKKLNTSSFNETIVPETKTEAKDTPSIQNLQNCPPVTEGPEESYFDHGGEDHSETQAVAVNKKDWPTPSELRQQPAPASSSTTEANHSFQPSAKKTLEQEKNYQRGKIKKFYQKQAQLQAFKKNTIEKELHCLENEASNESYQAAINQEEEKLRLEKERTEQSAWLELICSFLDNYNNIYLSFFYIYKHIIFIDTAEQLEREAIKYFYGDFIKNLFKTNKFILDNKQRFYNNETHARHIIYSSYAQELKHKKEQEKEALFDLQLRCLNRALPGIQPRLLGELEYTAHRNRNSLEQEENKEKTILFSNFKKEEKLKCDCYFTAKKSYVQNLISSPKFRVDFIEEILDWRKVFDEKLYIEDEKLCEDIHIMLSTNSDQEYNFLRSKVSLRYFINILSPSPPVSEVAAETQKFLKVLFHFAQTFKKNDIERKEYIEETIKYLTVVMEDSGYEPSEEPLKAVLLNHSFPSLKE